MMGLAATVVKAASVVTAVGVVGGGFATLESRHAPISVVGDISTIQIFELVETAQRDGKSDWICRAIEQEIARLCSRMGDHYFCGESGEDARQDIRKKAGCNDEE